MQTMMISGQGLLGLLNEEYLRGAMEAMQVADDLCWPTTDRYTPDRRQRHAVDPELIMLQLRVAANRAYYSSESLDDAATIDYVLGFTS